MSVSDKGKTVREAKVEKFTKAVVAGKPKEEAAKDAGLSLHALKKDGTLTKVVRELLAQVEQDKLLKKETLEAAAKARSLQLLMQDEDLRVALGAAKVILGSGPAVAVQINNNHLKTDPEVLATLKGLAIELDGEEEHE